MTETLTFPPCVSLPLSLEMGLNVWLVCCAGQVAAIEVNLILTPRGE